MPEWQGYPERVSDESGDLYWEERCFDQTVRDVSVPVHLMAGWYDIFLPWQLRDYHTLRENGQRPFLTIGPWSHTSPELSLFSLGEVIPWLQAVARGKEEQSQQRRAIGHRNQVAGGQPIDLS
jgi:predicted acyl esterase